MVDALIETVGEAAVTHPSPSGPQADDVPRVVVIEATATRVVAAGGLDLLTRPRARRPDARRREIGRDGLVEGAIDGCDELHVEGRSVGTRATLDHLSVAVGASVEGTVEAATADIAGRFEGTLIVRGRLAVRSTGRLRGRIVYKELAIECGGEITAGRTAA